MTDAANTQNSEPIKSFDDYLRRYFPASNPRVEKAVLALAQLTDNEFVDVMRKHESIRRWGANFGT